MEAAVIPKLLIKLSQVEDDTDVYEDINTNVKNNTLHVWVALMYICPPD